MSPIEIVVIVLAVLFVAGVAVSAAVRKIKGKTSSCGGGCTGCPYSASCADRMNAEKGKGEDSPESPSEDR